MKIDIMDILVIVSILLICSGLFIYSEKLSNTCENCEPVAIQLCESHNMTFASVLLGLGGWKVTCLEEFNQPTKYDIYCVN